MSNTACCDLNSKGDILKIHEKCPNPKCNCQKLITFTPHQDMLESNGFKNTMKKIVEGTQSAWNRFFKPAVMVAAPFIGMAVSGKTKTPKVVEATGNILKSISGGKNLSLTDMHGHELR